MTQCIAAWNHHHHHHGCYWCCWYWMHCPLNKWSRLFVPFALRLSSGRTAQTETISFVSMYLHGISSPCWHKTFRQTDEVEVAGPTATRDGWDWASHTGHTYTVSEWFFLLCIQTAHKLHRAQIIIICPYILLLIAFRGFLLVGNV